MYNIRKIIHCSLASVGLAPLKSFSVPLLSSKTHTHTYTRTVDREIFAVKKFSPVAWAAKIKHAKIKYMYTRFTTEPSGGEN